MRTALLFLILLAVAWPGLLVGQPFRADFTPDKNGGCLPLTVSFTNTSTGISPNTTYQWDFGNGNTSVLPNPGASFNEEKTFTVTLTIKDGSQVSTQSKTITVYKKPEISFTVSPSKGCLPLLVTFTNTSSPGDGYIAYSYWDFGDGATSQSTNHDGQHTYYFEQLATVSLTTANNYGCVSTLTKENIINIRPSLQAGFLADKMILCDAPGTVNFSNTSSGPGTLSYNWEFGDGATSDQKEPSHTYAQKGIYSVKLTVTSSEGCTQTAVRGSYINVGNFTSDFNFPSLICTNQYVTFNGNSTPVPNSGTWLIDGVYNYYTYGNGSVSYQFAGPGIHTIELNNDFGPCPQKIVKQVEIKKTPDISGFLANIMGLCGAPVVVNFRDTTSTAVKWKWNFNFGSSIPAESTLQAPSYTYQADDNYNVYLTVTTADGCSATTAKQVGVSRPLVGIFLDPDIYPENCGSVTAGFVARATEAISSYSWNFGDGATSSDPHPTHTYNQPGIYNVSLTYSTVNGCTGTAIYNGSVKVRQKPVANFSVQPTVCGNTPVNFINTTTGYVTTYIWNFGDNGGNNFSSEHRYQSEGDYTVTLIAYNGMCNDTVTKTAIIKVLPPFPKITGATNTCTGSRGKVVFTDGSQNVQSWSWDFGDGSAPLTYTSAQPTVEHIYTRTGKYNVTLTTTNGSCSVKDFITVFVLLKQSPVFALEKREACLSTSIGYTIRGLEVNPSPNNNGFNDSYYYTKMEYGDGTPLAGGYSSDFYPWKTDIAGHLQSYQLKDNQLRAFIRSEYFNCPDTTNYVPVKFNGVFPGFEIVRDNVCFKSPVTLRDTSKASPGNSIVSWQWNFGDGASQAQTEGNILNHTYLNPGGYYVNLRVVDAAGCGSSTNSYVQVTGPKVSFNASGSVVQLNSTVYFYNNSNTYNSFNTRWFWDFGNGATSTDYSPSYTFTQPGDYVITLTGENAATQCRDTGRMTITVKNFNTGFTSNVSFIGNNTQCPPVLARFSNTSVNYTRLEWDFGDGFTLRDQPYPSHVYNVPGVYAVVLKVYGYNGLTGTYRDTVFVNKPAATINADDLEGCIGHRVLLNAPVHTGASAYLWDFGNGKLTNNTDSFAVYQYQTPGSFTPSLIVKDDHGCPAYVTLPDKIIIHDDPVITVDPANGAVCKTNGIQLHATGGSTYQWSPAAGLSADNIASPMALPAATTDYSVTAKDNNGCTGKGAVTVIVPQAFTLSAKDNYEICKGENVKLNASGANTYQWINTTSGLDNILVASPLAAPAVNTIYTVVGYDQYQCYSDTVNVSVLVRPLPLVNAGPDKEVVFGLETTLNATGNDVVRWNWTPADYLSCTNCPSPVSKPYASMNYVVTGYTQYNCKATDTVAVKAICGGDHVYIPNAFTPGNDGKNDRLTIMGYGISNVRSLRIFNRWGEIVFEKKNFNPNDYNSAWNGKLKGVDAPAGIYVYFAEMECSTGERFERKGTVMLIR